VNDGEAARRLELPELLTVDLDGTIAFRSWEGPDDLTFVLLHGLGASHLSWVQVAGSLAGLGRVVAPDLPGFGASPLAGRRTGLMDQRRTVSRFLDEFGSPRVVLVGSSLAGAVALLEAAVEPDRVAGVVLSGSVYPWQGWVPPHPLVVLSFGLYRAPGIGERFVAWRLRALEPEQLVDLSLRFLAADRRSIPPDVVRLLVELNRARKDDPDVAVAFLEATRSLLRLGARPATARRALDNVRCPVLVLHGRRDRFVPVAFAEAELARHPGWRGRFFADLGHIPQMEAPGRWLAEVADWVSATLA
jgi:pimeloyl-ACP methyl ester carboxylesterase